MTFFAALLPLACGVAWLGLEYLLRDVDVTKYLGPDDIWSEEE